MGNKTVKKDEKIGLPFVSKNYKIKLEDSIVTLNVTRDFAFCRMNNSLKVRQFERKLLSFHPLIVVNHH